MESSAVTKAALVRKIRCHAPHKFLGVRIRERKRSAQPLALRLDLGLTFKLTVFQIL